MKRRLGSAVVAALCAPVLAFAVPVGREVRPHPGDISALPSYVQRVEPALVGLKVRAPEGAPSSARLGAQRFATGVVFDARGYAVTVTYAVMDAVRIDATLRDGRVVGARLIALDLDTGLAVVKLDGDGPWPAVALGQSRDVGAGATTGTVSVDEDNDLVHATTSVQSVRRFSAFWEYMLDRAFMVAPSVSSWGGAAVVDVQGRLIGIISLRLGEAPYVNLAIPVEKFLPVKDELIAAGRVVSRRPRPWIGLYTTATEGHVFVDGFNESGPARVAGFRKGDQIVRVNGVAVRTQEEFYEQMWHGQAGDTIEVAVRRADREQVIRVRSVDRHRMLRLQP